jgi:adenylyltransferase/sulfurtransferase
MASYQDLGAAEVAAMLRRGDPLRLIDVREPDEHRVAHVAGAELWPLSRARAWLPDVPRDTLVVFMCHHGMRSASVAGYLAERGYTRVANLAGGIDAWSLEVDGLVPRY